MKTVSLEEIPYSPDSCQMFERLRDLPGSAILDSSYPYAQTGRYDILVADPTAGTPIPPVEGETAHWENYFDELGRFHQSRFEASQGVSPDLPFCGGLLGYLGYDLGNPLNRVSGSSGKYSGAGLYAYDWAVVQDHLLQRAVLATQPAVSRTQQSDLLRRLRSRRSTVPGGFRLQENFEANMSDVQYREAFNRIQAYISAGDCYQVNLAQRFEAGYEGDPWQAYRMLRQLAAAPFSGYLSLDNDDALMCLSPERFLSLHGSHVQTSPIKGTRPRYQDPAADQLAAAELRRSEKDRAENLMIVDLLRNDLGRSCVPGSIYVDKLFEVQSFPTVHHLVSTISGELAPERSAYQLLRDSFPGGSITGAPKRRAMEIIAELEPHPREAYCGSLMYISADGRMDSNIAIRSLLCSESKIRCWGGGGIVADSQWQQEYQETFDKVGKFLTALEGLS
ncbi:aminodeoxychorismate synthase component I [Halioglobus maricola]|uniref:aminodeoxychorismate synthase n=1 Tax=Halioglobus maricola TaxID=2601894 RepID=A0A5P9NQS1_9GAMM|nr:aminodeoxychorismate synthase component I [Halioglobus maricola]